MRYHLDGDPRVHFIDFIVEWADGRREAFAVKHSEAAVAADGVEAVLRAICAEHGAEIADDFRTVTYETLDPVAVLNGRLILRCGRDRDHAALKAVQAALTRLGPGTTFREVALASGLGQRGVRAAVALLQSGILASPPGERLHLDLPLTNRAANANENGNHRP
ncbi:hypothetical protein FF100_18835 [Methylobacterium terricola]|uniref:TnsA endonuclease C terminal n=1 Tax=Methylobacterium terricola TaxID=2583531 RepID=A0A5C4LFE1_9HYPH|nr:hypothetical protein [Methylobacterium terricola]TNC11693.1 hypothetical protein FF100_18835 [Methylobacterium terricola]